MFQPFLIEKNFLTPHLRKNRQKTRKNEKMPIFWHQNSKKSVIEVYMKF